MSETDPIKFHLDAVAGAQLAMLNAVRLLLVPYRGNQKAIAAFQEDLERDKANLLASQSSDFKIRAYEETMETLIEALS